MSAKPVRIIVPSNKGAVSPHEILELTSQNVSFELLQVMQRCRYRGFLRVAFASKQNPSKSHQLGTSLWHQPTVGLPQSSLFSFQRQQNFALRASGDTKQRQQGPLCDKCLFHQGGSIYCSEKCKTSTGATWQLFYQRRTDHCHDPHSLNHIWSVHLGTGKSHCVSTLLYR